jgi:hypothetical protein
MPFVEEKGNTFFTKWRELLNFLIPNAKFNVSN